MSDCDALRATVRTWSRSARPLRDQVRPRPRRTAMYCDRSGCDGAPHGPWEWEHARSDQLPSNAPVLMYRAGRAVGKTYSASLWVCWVVAYTPEIGVIAPSHRHLREVCVEGQSGILQAARRLGLTVRWEPSRGLLTFPNGAKVWTYSSEDEDRLRGSNLGAAWLDEPAVMPNISELWDVLRYSVRVGHRLRYMLTTTPRPSKWIKEISSAASTELRVVPTHANARNLSPQFLATLTADDPTSRVYRQEVLGEILEDVAGALLTWEALDVSRVGPDQVPPMTRVLVGVDPAGGGGKRADETGIIVVGQGVDGHLYVLADHSGRYNADAWAREAWRAFDRWGASAIVAERNFGGDMVREVLRGVRSSTLDRIIVVSSRSSKFDRAEPIAAKFLRPVPEAHLVGALPELETQLTGWVPGEGHSPDRLDAFVHAARELVTRAESRAAIAIPRGFMGSSRNPSPRGVAIAALRASGLFPLIDEGGPAPWARR
jgi:phage terminase large subunit-like protein